MDAQNSNNEEMRTFEIWLYRMISRVSSKVSQVDEIDNVVLSSYEFNKNKEITVLCGHIILDLVVIIQNEIIEERRHQEYS